MTARPRKTPATVDAPEASLPATFADDVRAACDHVLPAVDLGALGDHLLGPLVSATGASRASLMMLNDETGRLRVAASVGIPAEYVGHDIPWRPGSISQWVLRERRTAVLNGEVTHDGLRGSAESHIESAICLPLEINGAVIGVLNLARNAPASRFRDEDRAAIEAILPMLAAALRRVSRARRGEDLVEQLDKSAGLEARTLLSRGLHELRGWEIGFARVTCPLHGGDVCERVTHAGGVHSLLAVDVAGHGVEAALTAAFVHGLFTASAAPERSTSGLVARVNSEVFQRQAGLGLVALWSAQFSAGGQVTSCTAGYPAPLWIPADGSPAVRLSSGGPMAGTVAQARWDEETVRLLPGDLLVVTSDGIPQAVRGTGNMFGDERLAELASERRRQPVMDIAGAVLQAVQEWTGRSLPLDDLAILVIRYSPGS